MSADSELNDELSQLAMEQLDGQLTAQQHTRLQELLRDNPAACAEYARLMALHAMLDTELNEFLPPLDLGERVAGLPQPVRRPQPGIVRSSTNFVRNPLAAALLVVVALAAAGLGIWRFAQPPVIATLTQSESARWAGGLTLADGQKLPQGEVLKLESGRAEIVFQSGASGIVEGPASLTLESPDAARLDTGKLTVHVPEQAHGFAVRTPLATVIDLGTEFELEIQRQSLHVRVLKGRVQVEPQTPPSDHEPMTSSPGFSKPLVLGAGQSVEIDSTGRIVPPPSETVQVMVPAAAPQEYQQAVLALKPTIYLPMEGDSEIPNPKFQIPNLAAPNNPATLHFNGSGAPFVPGRVGQALRLRGEDSGDKAIVPTGSMGVLTLAAWVYFDAEAAREVPIAWVAWDERRGGASLRITGSGELFGGGWVMVDKLRKRHVEIRESGTPFPRGAWQHVAFVADGEKFVLYRNGRVVGTQREGANALYEGTTGRGELSIGGDPVRIDEVALFDRPLSSEEVRKLYAEGPQK